MAIRTLSNIMKKTFILLSFPLVCLFSCSAGNAEVEEKAVLESRVMSVHDSAMARIGEIYKIRRQLRALRDTMEIQQADTAVLGALQQEINSLNQADEVMMQWMRQYKAPDTLQAKAAKEYLQNELVKIERVQTVMDSSIQAAQSTANKYDQQK
ncbi:hypothetical protein GCM10028895_48260 [Pontibacter rugosus]